jgi:hypothetical protein
MVPSSSVAFLLGDQRAGFFTLGNLGQELGLDLGGVIDTGRNAVGDQLDQEGFFAGRRVLQQFDQFVVCCLDRGSGGNTEGSALGNVLAIGFKQARLPVF